MIFKFLFEEQDNTDYFSNKPRNIAQDIVHYEELSRALQKQSTKLWHQIMAIQEEAASVGAYSKIHYTFAQSPEGIKYRDKKEAIVDKSKKVQDKIDAVDNLKTKAFKRLRLQYNLKLEQTQYAYDHEWNIVSNGKNIGGIKQVDERVSRGKNRNGTFRYGWEKRYVYWIGTQKPAELYEKGKFYRYGTKAFAFEQMQREFAKKLSE